MVSGCHSYTDAPLPQRHLVVTAFCICSCRPTCPCVVSSLDDCLDIRAVYSSSFSPVSGLTLFLKYKNKKKAHEEEIKTLKKDNEKLLKASKAKGQTQALTNSCTKMKAEIVDLKAEITAPKKFMVAAEEAAATAAAKAAESDRPKL